MAGRETYRAAGPVLQPQIVECLSKRVRYHALAQAAVGVVQKGLRPVIPGSCPAGLAAVMRECWQRDPRERPSFETLKARAGPPASCMEPNLAAQASGERAACLSKSCAWRACMHGERVACMREGLHACMRGCVCPQTCTLVA
jgi:hypothetical protein